LPDFTVEQDRQFPVFTIITSNNEKGLPDAFLRRCVFHHISFPGAKELLQIVRANLKTDNTYFDTVIERFTELRNKNLVKKPATAELIDWIACLQQKKLLNSNMANWKGADDDYKTKLIETLGIITKSQADFDLTHLVARRSLAPLPSNTTGRVGGRECAYVSGLSFAFF